MPDAGTVTLAEQTFSSVKKLAYTWLSDGAGAADKQSVEVYDGRLIAAAFVPDSGATTPDPAYDVTLEDEDGIDVLTGLGANLSNAAAVLKADTDGLGAVAAERLYLHVTGAGAGKGGRAIVYVR